ncbi:MAG: extracellular solute-binding protein [Leptolyngbyaceae bacterium]|nr:extracellular solute-binding protein [Leptolyngbyaceae bacterium]
MPQCSGQLGRRSLLLGFGSLALTQLIHGCGAGGRSPQFVVEFLASSIPATLLKQVTTQLQSSIDLQLIPVSQFTDSQLAHQLRDLQKGKGERETRPPSLPNLAAIGDGWLAPAIQAQSLQPLMLDQQAGWKRLPPFFQQLVRRDRQGMPDAAGEIWAAPYRWGQLMIAYRTDKLAASGWTPTDWDSLWDAPIQRRLSLPDHERLVLGLVLKALGQSVNTPDLDSVRDLSQRLAALQQQVKFYSSDNYLQPLFLEDTWVAVGWSMDILPVVQRDPRIKAIVPASGTMVTADLWVQPCQTAMPTPETGANSPGTDQSSAKLLQDWISFFWQPETVIQLSLLSNAASPVILGPNLAPDAALTLPPALTHDSLLIPAADVMAQSEFVQPLEPSAMAQYQQYWQTMRMQV